MPSLGLSSHGLLFLSGAGYHAMDHYSDLWVSRRTVGQASQGSLAPILSVLPVLSSPPPPNLLFNPSTWAWMHHKPKTAIVSVSLPAPFAKFALANADGLGATAALPHILLWWLGGAQTGFSVSLVLLSPI